MRYYIHIVYIKMLFLLKGSAIILLSLRGPEKKKIEINADIDHRIMF